MSRSSRDPSDGSRPKSAATSGRLRTTLPWSIAALGGALLPHLATLPLWVTLVFGVCAGWRWHVELRRGRLPTRLVRTLFALVSFVCVLAAYRGINGVGPGTSLLVVMAALKLLETRSRRDQIVLLFIALFLVLAACLKGQAIWSLPYIVAAVWLIGAAWVNVARFGAALPPRRAAAASARLLGQALPVMLALWVLFPRVPGPFWAIPTAEGGGVSGLDETMSPGDISALGLSSEVAFRVRFEGEPPPPAARYWRGIVLHRYDGRTWSGSEPGFWMLGESSVETAGEPYTYTVTLEPTHQHRLFTLEMARWWDAERVFMSAQHELMRRRRPIDELLAYRVRSYPAYRIDADLKRRYRDYYRRLPANNPEAAAFAARLRAEAGDEAAFVRRVLEHFRNQPFHYTLQPPPLGSDPVDEFLFGTRRGFCEHYAAAFTVLARAAGIPARVVAGYQGGEINPHGNYMIVRQSDAHAWAEVWLAGRGWVRVDPTAAVAPERIEQGADAAFARLGIGGYRELAWVSRAVLVWDSLNARWNDWVLGYGPDAQRDFLRWLGMDDPRWEKLVTLLVAILGIAMGALALWLAWRYRPPPADAAARLYRRFAARLGLSPRTGEAPLAFAERAARARPSLAPDIGRISRLYLRARYAEPAALETLREAVRRFRPPRARATSRG